MCERVPRQRRMVGLDIELEVAGESVLAQEADHREGIEVVLVLHRFHGFGFDQERALEPHRPAVIARLAQKHRHMFEFPPRVGVLQAGVALAPAPEHVVLSAQLNGGVDRGLYLRGGIGDDGEVRICGCAVHIARMRKHVRRAP